MKSIKYFSIALIVMAAILFVTYDSPNYQVLQGETMGTTYSIKIRTHKNNHMLHTLIRQKLADINHTMSVFEQNSEINKINEAPADEWVELSPEMSKLLKSSYTIYKKTGGAFDPTSGKLVNLWGFGPVKTGKTPSQEEINEVLSYSGFNRIKFSADYTKLKKENKETLMNLSAIAKGYGVDEIAKLLLKEGYKNFLVEIGGEIYAHGNREKNENGWNVGIMNPADNSETAVVVNLKDSAVATSGDYFNYIRSGDNVYSHTISMKDGKPVKNNLTSVTVFGDNCQDIDAYATAFMAMGEKQAISFANRNNIEAIFFVKNEDGDIETIVSNRAKKFFEKSHGKN